MALEIIVHATNQEEALARMVEMEKNYGKDFELIKETHFEPRLINEDTMYQPKSQYRFSVLKGQVLETKSCNIGYWDDYRAGIMALVKLNGEFKFVTVSAECGENATKDATKELIQEHDAFVKYRERKGMLENKLSARKDCIEFARAMNINNYHEVKKLKIAMGSDWDDTKKLLISFTKGKLRSSFKTSIASQIYTWLMDPNRVYKCPLSDRQRAAAFKKFDKY